MDPRGGRQQFGFPSMRAARPFPDWDDDEDPRFGPAPAGFFRPPRGSSFDSFPSDFPSHFGMNPRFGPAYEAFRNGFDDEDFLPRAGGADVGEPRPAPAADTQPTVIPIRVIHEKPGRTNEGNVNGSASSKGGSESPRTGRARSEPPKTASAQGRPQPQTQPAHFSPIPEGGVAVDATGEPSVAYDPAAHNHLSTSASAPHVPHSHSQSQSLPEAPVPPPRRPSPTKAAREEAEVRRRQHHEQHDNNPTGVRHIPIFVEGRDEPVRRRANDEPEPANSFRKPSDYYPSNVQRIPRNYQRPDDLPSARPSSLRTGPCAPPAPPAPAASTVSAAPAAPTSPLGPPPGPIPMGYTPSKPQTRPEATSPPLVSDGPIPMGCSQDLLDAGEASGDICVQSAEADSSGGEQGDAPQAPPPQQPSTSSSSEADPVLSKLQKVQDNVSGLINQIEAFKGKKTDKDYLYLDEMLTRNLLVLDSVETNGREDLRQLRREMIRSINRCVSMLDHKAVAVAPSDADDNNRLLAELAAKSAAEDAVAADRKAPSAHVHPAVATEPAATKLEAAK